MAVTIYRSTDSGAPVLPANADYVAASFYMDIIKKCLVTGYGSKAGAGWSLVYEDTTANKRRLAVSNGNGVMEFITWSTRSIGMMMWDSITTPGVGRLYNDSFTTVMSKGVNGWKSKLVVAPGAASGQIMSLGLPFMETANSASIGWTVFADDKSAWIIFHYPAGNTNAEGADEISTSYAYHPQLFFGAVKSPDLARNQLGNFFVCYSGSAAGNASDGSNYAENLIGHFWGLRTPMNTVPTVANTSEFNWNMLQSFHASYSANPYSSVRVLIPVVMTYKGKDVVKVSAQNADLAHYGFASIPGLAQFSDSGSGDFGYWRFLNIARGATWNQQTYSVNGVDWMPYSAYGQNQWNNLGVTNNADWWS